MQKRLGYWLTIVVVFFTATFSAGAAPTEELIVKNCTELIRMAQSLSRRFENCRHGLGLSH